jgi:hypothetical protein
MVILGKRSKSPAQASAAPTVSSNIEDDPGLIAARRLVEDLKVKVAAGGKALVERDGELSIARKALDQAETNFELSGDPPALKLEELREAVAHAEDLLADVRRQHEARVRALREAEARVTLAHQKVLERVRPDLRERHQRAVRVAFASIEALLGILHDEEGVFEEIKKVFQTGGLPSGMVFAQGTKFRRFPSIAIGLDDLGLVVLTERTLQKARERFLQVGYDV